MQHLCNESQQLPQSVGNAAVVKKEELKSLVEIPDSNSMAAKNSNCKKIDKSGQETSSQSGNVEVRRPESTPRPISPSPQLKTNPPFKKDRAPLFKPDELRHTLAPTMEKLYQQDPESIPFRHPVDPKALGIPDYFNIIKKPMDLSTIKKKLDSGQYMDPWDFIDDVWQMFINAWIYNKNTSRVYRYCTKLVKFFEQEIDPVMQSLGYCCGHKYTFKPQVLCCYGKQLCTIPRHAKYFRYYNRYTYCEKCFNDIQGITISLGDDPSQQDLKIEKSQFIELKNDDLVLEPMVECLDCGRKQHQICVLHMEKIWPNGFTCNGCLKKIGQKKKDNKFTAKMFPTTKLSSYLETKVNNFLKEKEAGAGEVFIRVLSSKDKSVKVKGGMKTRFVDTGHLSAKFSYHAKAIFAYEEIDGVDVCFFGMHVQEYGSDAPCPNTRRVYLAYLDIVHFFKPKEYRTAVYHEILLGYLDYVKQLGYTMAHMWVWPSSEGDDYIFNCHPLEQKYPKPKQLQDWYKKMLDKGVIESIVLDYKDIHKQALEDNLKSPSELPYFDGDFWPIIMEESIKELDQEEEKHKQEEAANGSQCNDLAKKIYTTMEKHKDVFFVIRLHSAQSAMSLPPIEDPDLINVCDLMDGRDAFLTLASECHLEFSSLRRAKYSTMCMLYELHTQGKDHFVYTCNSCKTHVVTRYHCQECDDYNLCTTCFKTEGHSHNMELLVRQQRIQNCIKSLDHATQCCDANCCLPSCQKIKYVRSHAKSCKKEKKDGCVICNQFLLLCRYHAKNCKEQCCRVPFCYYIKQDRCQLEIQQRFQQQALMKRRMQQMNLSIGGGGPQPASPALTQAVSQPMQSLIQQPQHSGVKPAQVDPPNVLQSLKMDLFSLTQNDDRINLDEVSNPPVSSNDPLVVIKSKKRPLETLEISCVPKTYKRFKSEMPKYKSFEEAMSNSHNIAKINNSDAGDQYTNFGHHIASQLRELPLERYIVLQQNIQNLITQERIASLSDINPSPSTSQPPSGL